MLKKNIEKQKNKQRPSWSGLYTRKTPTKKALLIKKATKYKGKEKEDI